MPPVETNICADRMGSKNAAAVMGGNNGDGNNNNTNNNCRVRLAATNTVEGHDSEPEGEQQDDNKFVALYRDPDFVAPRARVIYLSRHGESEFNLYGKIGGNSPLSPQGEKYSERLAEYMASLDLKGMKVWTSELKRTKQTSQFIDAPKNAFWQLNEINSGDHDGMTYEDIAEKFPIEFANRDSDKLRYRYPRGESYVDVCERLCEIMREMNLCDNLLVISHQAVVRCILTCLMKWPVEKLPYVKVPLHAIMKITFDGGKNVMEVKHLGIECVDTYRPQPANCRQDRNIADALQTVPLHL